MTSREHLKDLPHDVYRYYDKEGVLLYVGCTSDLHVRDAAHRRDKEWYPLVARLETERFSNRFAGVTAEKAYIERFRPQHNRTLNLRAEPITVEAFEREMAIARDPDSADDIWELYLYRSRRARAS